VTILKAWERNDGTIEIAVVEHQVVFIHESLPDLGNGPTSAPVFAKPIRANMKTALAVPIQTNRQKSAGQSANSWERGLRDTN